MTYSDDDISAILPSIGETITFLTELRDAEETSIETATHLHNALDAILAGALVEMGGMPAHVLSHASANPHVAMATQWLVDD